MLANIFLAVGISTAFVFIYVVVHGVLGLVSSIFYSLIITFNGPSRFVYGSVFVLTVCQGTIGSYLAVFMLARGWAHMGWELFLLGTTPGFLVVAAFELKRVRKYFKRDGFIRTQADIELELRPHLRLLQLGMAIGSLLGLLVGPYLFIKKLPLYL